ncbi:MAG: hypothetical protein LE178_02250 [Endomicrobium sp.]|nr:hypothetical protein [Endomicrobium sp.]
MPFGSVASGFQRWSHSVFQEEYEPEKIRLLSSSTKSKNFKKVHFTNYMSSNKCKEWSVLADICNKLKAGLTTELLREFKQTEIEDRNKDKLMRLCKIISQSRNRICYTKCKISNKCFKRNVLKTLENKYRYSKKRNVYLRIFARKVRDTVYVCLIDLHHLAVPAVNRQIKRRSSYEENYAKKNNFKWCISSVDIK